MVSINLCLLVLAATGVSSTWSTSINSVLTNNFQLSGYGVGSALIDSLANGMQMAIDYCQEKFKWDRWNCPDSAFSRRGRQPATRETAFVFAMTSAGIVHSITKNCSRGDIPGCGCGPIPEDEPVQIEGERWTWGGCSDHLEFAQTVAENILGQLERGMDSQAFVNIRNNAAGILAVKSTMKKRCKCLGVSGSCTLQTCWMQMASFSEVTSLLRRKYENAIRLDFEAGANKVAIGNAVNSLNDKIMDEITETNPDNLIYLIESPDYCKPNAIYGWNGTLGRSCSRSRDDKTTSSERKSCKNLCKSCGHKIQKDKRVYTKRCNCVFEWCCEVKCDTCQETVEEYYCK